MMVYLDELGDYFRRYSQDGFADEPNYVAACHAVAESPEALALVAAHPRRSHQPNMLLAAVHDLVLSGVDHPLADMYRRSAGGDSTAASGPVDGVGAAFVDFVLANRDAIDERLATRFTQTNEVGRGAVLALLLGQAASRAESPLAWIDLGTSAGLNLNLDAMRIDYRDESGLAGAARVNSLGPRSARLAISTGVRSGFEHLPVAMPEIAWRCGVDRSPLDVTDPEDARWLRACLWPSATERRERLDRAIDTFAAKPARIIAADAVDGLADAVDQAPAELALVVSTTWVWYYLDQDTRSAVLAIMGNADRPVTWVSLEGRGVVDRIPQVDTPDGSVLGEVHWPGSRGEPTRAHDLGTAHPHGTWIEWVPGGR